MIIEEYLIKEAIFIQWPATFKQILVEAVKSSYKWFVLCSEEKIVGCIRRETIYDNVKEMDITKLNSFSIESMITEVLVVDCEDIDKKIYKENKIIVVKNGNGEIKGVIDWEFDKNIRNIVTEDEWLIKEFQTVFNEFYQNIFVTDDKGKVIRVTSKDDQQHLGKNIFELEKERIFYPSFTAKVLRTGKREKGLQYTNSGEVFNIESIPVKNDKGEIVRVVSLTKDSSEINQLKERLEESRILLDSYQREIARIQKENSEGQPFIYKSKEMEKLFELAKSVASIDASVLILGETGVGKQMIANQIHLLSHRSDKPFITVNCGAIPENLLESELFGYEEGAFSGTRKGGKLGIFEIADKGILFLDEIGEMPLHLQVKLLRVLQEKVIMRVGGTKEKKIDVRIITATNKNLEQMVKERTFREDLYYRINVVPIRILPLRERKGDIQALAFFFLNKFNRKYQKNIGLDSSQLDQILRYSWPGNVRELENMMERFVVMEKTIFFDETELDSPNLAVSQRKEGELPTNLLEFIRKVEKNILIEAMASYKTTREMAKKLGVDQSTIVRKLQKYNMGNSN